MTSRNSQKLAHLQQIVKELLEEVLKQGFYGMASVKFKVQDGTIQTIRRRVERIDR
jgi:hypothetical protein